MSINKRTVKESAEKLGRTISRVMAKVLKNLGYSPFLRLHPKKGGGEVDESIRV